MKKILLLTVAFSALFSADNNYYRESERRQALYNKQFEDFEKNEVRLLTDEQKCHRILEFYVTSPGYHPQRLLQVYRWAEAWQEKYEFGNTNMYVSPYPFLPVDQQLKLPSKN